MFGAKKTNWNETLAPRWLSSAAACMGLIRHARFVTMMLMKSILDPSFEYQPSYATDIRRTFERARQQQPAAGANERKPQEKIRSSC